MRNYSKTVGALAAASALVAGNALAEVEGEVHVGYASMYEFRFVDYGNNLVDAGIDLATSVGNWGFNAGAWYGSFDAAGSLGNTFALNNDELDLYAGISYNWECFSLEAGYIYYYFGQGGGKTQEVYVSGTAEFAWGFGAESTYYYDFDNGNGWYWDNKLTYSWEINPCLSLDCAAGIAYGSGNDFQGNANPFYGGYGSNNGMQGWYVSAALPWNVRENVVISPYVRYTDGDSGLQTGPNFIDVGQQFLIGGVSVAVSF